MVGGFVSFNDPGDLREKVKLAVRQARLVGHDSSQIAPVKPVQDVYEEMTAKDSSKVALCREDATGAAIQ